jgi:lactoylglutathione lyase
MIEGPRALRIPVPDLAIASDWYARAFETEPTDSRDDGVTFHIHGIAVMLVTGHPQPVDAPVLYWGVDDVRAEYHRMSGLQSADGNALASLRDGALDAILHDPFGNALGLTTLGDPGIRRARNQRSAEKIALRNVRETLDSLEQDEQFKKQSHRWVLITLAAVIAALLALLGTTLLHSRQSLQDQKPLPIPRLERH